MSDRHGLLTETELDGLLAQWLSEGAAVGPDRVVERATQQVATVRQEGAPLRGIGMVSRRAPLGWAAVAFAALLVAIGLFFGRGLVGDRHSPSPSPRESRAPIPELRLYTNAQDGYQIALPPSWADHASTILRGDEPYRGVRKFGPGLPGYGHPALTISIGEPDGSVVGCRYGWVGRGPAIESCEKVVARTLDELGELLVSNPNGSTESHGDALLAGVPARFESYPSTGKTCDGCPGALYHVFAIDEGRPVILAFSYWNIDSSRDRLQRILDSFRFLDPTTGKPRCFVRVLGTCRQELPDHPIDPPVAPMRAYDLGGFSVDVPNDWQLTREDDAASFVGQWDEFSVHVGTETGEIQTCEIGAGRWEHCRLVIGSTIDELTEAVSPTGPTGYDFAYSWPDKPMTLGGELARRTDIAAADYPAHGAEHVTYVIAFHDGRPVIVRFHTTREHPPAVWEEIIASFRFVD